MPTRVERFLDHLDSLTGGIEPEFHPVSPQASQARSVHAITYRGFPETGLMLAFTFGLSARRQPAWTHGRPELTICIESDDMAWSLAVASLAAELGDECPFSYGMTIDFGRRISEESRLDGFVVFAPFATDPEHAQIDVGDDVPVNLVGLYPTYAAEREFVAEHGLDRFWQLDWDPMDVRRPPAV